MDWATKTLQPQKSYSPTSISVVAMEDIKQERTCQKVELEDMRKYKKCSSQRAEAGLIKEPCLHRVKGFDSAYSQAFSIAINFSFQSRKVKL